MVVKINERYEDRLKIIIPLDLNKKGCLDVVHKGNYITILVIIMLLISGPLNADTVYNYLFIYSIIPLILTIRSIRLSIKSNKQEINNKKIKYQLESQSMMALSIAYSGIIFNFTRMIKYMGNKSSENNMNGFYIEAIGSFFIVGILFSVGYQAQKNKSLRACDYKYKWKNTIDIKEFSKVVGAIAGPVGYMVYRRAENGEYSFVFIILVVCCLFFACGAGAVYFLSENFDKKFLESDEIIEIEIPLKNGKNKS